MIAQKLRGNTMIRIIKENNGEIFYKEKRDERNKRKEVEIK